MWRRASTIHSTATTCRGSPSREPRSCQQTVPVIKLELRSSMCAQVPLPITARSCMSDPTTNGPSTPTMPLRLAAENSMARLAKPSSRGC